MSNTTSTISVAQRLQQLRERRSNVEDEARADPQHAASDPSAWYRRDERRRAELKEIELDEANLREFGVLYIDHLQAVRQYINAGSAIKARLVDPAQPGTIQYTALVRNGPNDLVAWLRSLREFSLGIGDSEESRAIVARELDAWFTARTRVVRASLSERDVHVPAPELNGDLPSWCRVGVYRIDTGA